MSEVTEDMPDDFSKGEILIVDDSMTNRFYLANILKKDGYRVTDLGNGDTALELIQERPFDLVLLDIDMPEMDGYEVCRQIKTDPQTANIPVLFISGFTEEENKVKGFEVGGIDYITKPFMDREVLARVHFHLESSRQERGLKNMVDERTSKLRLEQERFKRVFDLASDAFFIVDSAGKIVDVNHQACQVLGYDREEILSLWIEDIVVGLHRDQILKIQKTADETGHIITRGQHRRKDGSILPVEVSIGLLQRGDHNLYLAIARNTTERLKTQEALRREKEFAETILNSQLDSFAILEPSGKVLRWNHVFREMTGYSDEEIASLPAPLSYVDPADHERVNAFVNTVLKDGSGKIEADVVCKDGRRIPTEYNVVVLGREDREQQLIIAVGRDLTERKRIEEQARQSAKMEAIGHLAGGIAHDFNNIIAGIVGLAELVVLKAPSGSSSERHLQKILKACGRAEHLVQQILAFSRQQKDTKRPIYLKPTIEEAVQLLKASLPSSIEINVKLSDDTHRVFADSTKIHEIVVNLCTNAAHAMEEKGLLEISLFEEEIENEIKGEIGPIRPGRYSILETKDTGCGMESDIISHIFEPFFTTKQVGTGTGMGLAVVFGIVKAHDGNILVESILGKGTTFRVFLPKTEESPEEEDNGETFPSVRGGTERVLFVDDEENMREIVDEMLRQLGYEVTAFGDSISALRAFEKSPDSFDLVISDQTMPFMSGLELSEKMRRLRPQLPVIICTGYSRKLEEEAVGEKREIDVIMKPFRFCDIAEKIREVLERRQGPEPARPK